MKSATIIRLALIFGMIILITIYLFTNMYAPFFTKGITFVMGILTALWLFSLVIKDSSIIDIFWGLGFVLIAWFYMYQLGWDSISTRQMVFLSMVSLWGLRLFSYLAYRNIGKDEDYRYQQWRKESGKNWWWFSYIRVFVLQGFILWIISACYLPALMADVPLGGWDYLGILLFSIGLFFEAVGDWQLAQFKKDTDNKGKVMNKGLWKYTRHPNYFGDSLLWWGFFCFSLSHPNGIYYIFGPIIMTFFLLKVSGVAMLERSLKKTKPKYKEYMRKTSSFIPMPPKQ